MIDATFAEFGGEIGAKEKVVDFWIESMRELKRGLGRLVVQVKVLLTM